MEKANLLILDEPTNHLDIYSIEVLEDALEDYEGTLLVVSHNRHFLDVVCNTIYYLDENGLKKFKGNYEDYKASLKNSGNNEQGEEKEEKKVSYQEQKEMSRKIAKLKKDIEKLEEISLIKCLWKVTVCRGNIFRSKLKKSGSRFGKRRKHLRLILIRIKRNTMFLRCSRIIRAIFIWGM